MAHTVAMLPSNHKLDEAIDLLLLQLWNNQLFCLVPWKNDVLMT